MGSRDKNPWLAHWCCSSASPSHPCDCPARIFLLCREMEGRTGGRKTSASFLQMYSSPDKSCQQPAEGTAEQTLLGPVTPPSLCHSGLCLWKPTSITDTNQGCRGCAPACRWLGGICCVEALSSITGLESKRSLATRCTPAEACVQADRASVIYNRTSMGIMWGTAALCPSRGHASHHVAETV